MYHQLNNNKIIYHLQYKLMNIIHKAENKHNKQLILQYYD